MTDDFLIVGAGIVGLTIARELISRFPLARIVIIEKEHEIGFHASGRNSGVLHSGIYYPPMSLKAKVCANGGKLMMDYARQEKIKFEQKGKLILATHPDDLGVVDKLLLNAKKNEIPAERVDTKTAIEIEPHVNKDNHGGIFCSSTAVINGMEVLQSIYQELKEAGVKFYFGTRLLAKSNEFEVVTNNGKFRFSFLVNSAGAYADQIAQMFGLSKNFELLPFKGIYWRLASASNYKVRSNIYPVPDMNLPFLGVHLTRNIHNEIYIGPTAIPSLGRENYKIFSGLRPGEALSIFKRLSLMYLSNRNNMRKVTHQEIAKYSKLNFLKDIQNLVPSIKSSELCKSLKVGIRPQLVNKDTNELEMDYVLEAGKNSIHILNAISPAFTGSFEFAKIIVSNIERS